MRTNRPSSPTPEPRHRQPGPARLGGTAPAGKRARPATDEHEDQEDQTWPRTASGR